MKTQHINNKLALAKQNLIELNDKSIRIIKGGGKTSLGCSLCINSSNGPGNEYLNQIKL